MISLLLAAALGWSRLSFWWPLLLVAGLTAFNVTYFAMHIRPYQLRAGLMPETLVERGVYGLATSAAFVAIGYGMGWLARKISKR